MGKNSYTSSTSGLISGSDSVDVDDGDPAAPVPGETHRSSSTKVSIGSMDDLVGSTEDDPHSPPSRAQSSRKRGGTALSARQRSLLRTAALKRTASGRGARRAESVPDVRAVTAPVDDIMDDIVASARRTPLNRLNRSSSSALTRQRSRRAQTAANLNRSATARVTTARVTTARSPTARSASARSLSRARTVRTARSARSPPARSPLRSARSVRSVRSRRQPSPSKDALSLLTDAPPSPRGAVSTPVLDDDDNDE